MALDSHSRAGKQLFENVFGQKAAVPSTQTSVLEGWNEYSTASAGPSQSQALLSQMEEGSASLQHYISSSFSKVSDGVQGVSTGVSTQLSSFQMPTATQLAYSLLFVGSGIFFLVLAFSLFLPVVMLAPSKFAICFTSGSMLVLIGCITMRGWQTQVSNMLSSKRLGFTSVYAVTIIATLYAALAMHSYSLSLLACVAQVLALFYYIFSYFPGGLYGLKYLLHSVQSAFMRCFLTTASRI